MSYAAKTAASPEFLVLTGGFQLTCWASRSRMASTTAAAAGSTGSSWLSPVRRSLTWHVPAASSCWPAITATRNPRWSAYLSCWPSRLGSG